MIGTAGQSSSCCGERSVKEVIALVLLKPGCWIESEKKLRREEYGWVAMMDGAVCYSRDRGAGKNNTPPRQLER